MKRISLLFAFLLCAFGASAQFINSGGNVDNQPYNYGFYISINRNAFDIRKVPDFNQPQQNPFTNDTLFAIKPVGLSGFALGLVGNLKINDNLDLRATPGFSFVDRQLEYQYNQRSNPNNIVKVVETSFLEFPFSVKYKSNRSGNYRAYFLGGFKITADVTARRKKDDDGLAPEDDARIVKMKNGYLSYEAGVGVDIYNQFFKSTLEIKFSRSFGNTLNDDDHKFTRPINKLFAEMFQFTIYFE